MAEPDKNSISVMDLKRLKLHLLPDPVLRTVCKEIVIFDKRLQTFAKKMTAFMKRSKGIGLAGPQVGVLQRIIAIGAYDRDLVLVNPRIVPASIETCTEAEGCLSVPGRTFNVPRLFRIEVQAYDIAGSEVHFSADSIGARVIQHEVDHLDGVLICDTGTGIEMSGGADIP